MKTLLLRKEETEFGSFYMEKFLLFNSFKLIVCYGIQVQIYYS